MHRPAILSMRYSSGDSESCPNMSARLLLPLTLWLFVSVSLRYGLYGNHHLVLGPNSSRLMEASSVFVEQIRVRGDARKGLSLYGFLEKPELSLETNWTASNYLFADAYGRQGFSLWLNKGSKLQITWKIQHRRSGDMFVVLIKGEKNFETLMKQPTTSHALGFMKLTDDNGEAEYTVEEDDSYYIGVVNLYHQSIVVEMKLDLSSKIYDTTRAKSQCSTAEGCCMLKLPFPNTQYVVLATPNDDNGDAWYVELSFVGRLVTYVVILGFLVLIICLLFKCIGACENERVAEEEAAETTETDTETDPLVPTKEIQCLYGAMEEDDSEAGLDSSSSDLYDGKICVICYDEQRNCFFVPCGHCATCYACAQRIVDGDNKACPICRSQDVKEGIKVRLDFSGCLRISVGVKCPS
ncbi:zf-C3HC4_3 domain-containing protein [Cinnamomum micranthum f. kanehirae]|uniref:Zf-C3HC4_3 domain-containing protein n=1 Tax=Cinnamomum micranthum f. kanehirae TaxID=337451 RepID=A0A3S3QDG8_9MAGN|nr:zf-C3HC4_3 domain-containing protein [Cinnamomum micranthum f. kanehirae]